MSTWRVATPDAAGIWMRRRIAGRRVERLEVFRYAGVWVYYTPGRRDEWNEFGWVDRLLYRYSKAT